METKQNESNIDLQQDLNNKLKSEEEEQQQQRPIQNPSPTGFKRYLFIYFD